MNRKRNGIATQWNITGDRKEWNSNPCYNMYEPWKHYVTWNKPSAKGYILYNTTYMKYME